MHDRIKHWHYQSRNTIIAVNKVDYNDNMIKAVITTKHFKRYTTRPYEFNLSEWAETIERGWIE